MLQMLGAVAPLAKILFSTIEKSVPDKDLQAKLKAELQTQLLQSNTQELVDLTSEEVKNEERIQKSLGFTGSIVSGITKITNTRCI